MKSIKMKRVFKVLIIMVLLMISYHAKSQTTDCFFTTPIVSTVYDSLVKIQFRKGVGYWGVATELKNHGILTKVDFCRVDRLMIFLGAIDAYETRLYTKELLIKVIEKGE